MRSLTARFSRRIALTGIALVGLGLAESFELEHHGSFSLGNAEFRFLEVAFLPTLGVGLLAMLLGMIAWGRYLRRKRKYQVAVTFLGAGLLILAVPINIHGWTAPLIFVMFGSWATSIALAWMAEEP